MRQTLQQRYIAGLTRLGYNEYTAKRYVGCRAFIHPDSPTRVVFIGKRGSVRAGQNRVTCRNVSDRFKQELLS